MKKIFLFITLGLFAISAFSQQQQNRHEFSVWAGGGMNSLRSTDLAVGENSLGFGMLGGIGYNYFFNYNWSIGSGVEFSWLNGGLKYNNGVLNANYHTTDGAPAGSLGFGDFKLTYNNASAYEESLRAFYINIPLMVKYQFDVWKEHKFYAAAGMKFGIVSFGGNFEGTGGDFRIQEHLADMDTPLPAHGISLASVDGDVDFKFNYILSAEAGMKWKFDNEWSLYTGVYFDYGLTNIRPDLNSVDDNQDQLVQYNKPTDHAFYTDATYELNSALTSRYNGVEMAGKVNTIGLGIKAQLAFGIEPFTRKPSKAELAALKAAEEEAARLAAANKPYEGLTASQMADIMSQSNKEMMDFQRKEFDALKELLTVEAPELMEAIINFDLNKKEILPRMYAELDRKVELMNQHPRAKLMLEGHTDDLGSMEYNYQLGLDRAQATKDYLVKKGINPNRLVVSSKGKTQPLVPNSDEANRFKNRRVEFILQP